MTSFQPKIAIDTTDLIEFINAIGHVTGIQRVQVQILKRIMANDFTPLGALRIEREVNVVCMHGPWGYGLRSIDQTIILELIDYLDGASVDHNKTEKIVDRIYGSEKPIELKATDCLLILGAFWNYPYYPQEISRLASADVKIALLCYDLIPIEAPEYCVPTLSGRFASSVRTIFPFVHLFICISEYTATSVRRQLASIRSACDTQIHQDVKIIPLAHDFGTQTVSSSEVERAIVDVRKKRDFPKGRYALFVGTIEARKNLGFLCDVWNELKNRFGDALPDLVLAGRPGWNVENLLDLIHARNARRKYIYIVNRLSDIEITALYRFCDFVVYPSLLEGWGLPVGEALTEGKLVFASMAASIPEVGGDHVIYIDPLNVRNTADKIAEIVDNPERLEVVRQEKLDGFIQRNWDDVYHDFVTVLTEAGRFWTKNPSDRNITPSDIGVKKITYDSVQYPTPASLALKTGWHLVENWGAWSSEREAEITFRIPHHVEMVDLDLYLQATPWCPDTTIGIWDYAGEPRFLRTLKVSLEPKWFRVTTSVISSVLRIKLILPYEHPMNNLDMDARNLGFGVLAYCYMPPGDQMARIQALEVRALGQQLIEVQS